MGNIGIGTTNPGTNKVQIGVGTTGIYINSLGNIGIGTTNPGTNRVQIGNNTPDEKSKQILIGNDGSIGIGTIQLDSSRLFPQIELFGTRIESRFSPIVMGNDIIFNKAYAYSFTNEFGIRAVGNWNFSPISPWWSLIGNDTSVALNWHDTANNWAFTWQSDRNVVLTDNGVSVWATNTSTSDRNLKENIIPTSISAINVITQLEVVDFNWKHGCALCDEGKPHVGFIAQDVELVIPDSVKVLTGKKQTKDNEGNVTSTEDVETYILHKEEIIPYLTKAIQEQQEIIEQLKQRLDTAGIAWYDT